MHAPELRSEVQHVADRVGVIGGGQAGGGRGRRGAARARSRSVEIRFATPVPPATSPACWEEPDLEELFLAYYDRKEADRAA
jgi:hypothetical protein